MDFDIDKIYEDLPEMSLVSVVTLFASGAMVFGGVIPYIPQYRTIRKTSSCEGFSTLVCFVLLLANLLRIFFWFGKQFELPLLAQSVLMILAMLVMVELCVNVRNQSEIVPYNQRRFRDFDWNYFWKWTDFQSYLEFVVSIALLLSISTYIFLNNYVYVESLGFLAVFIEAMLGTPQLYKNFVAKSTEGMSVSMVAMWFCGDTFKTGYFIVRSAPAQFWLCGGLQILVDIAILFQVFYYSMSPRKPLPGRHAQ